MVNENKNKNKNLEIMNIINTLVLSHIFFKSSPRGDFETYEFLVSSMTQESKNKYFNEQTLPFIKTIKEELLSSLRADKSSSEPERDCYSTSWFIEQLKDDLTINAEDAAIMIESVVSGAISIGKPKCILTRNCIGDHESSNAARMELSKEISRELFLAFVDEIELHKLTRFMRSEPTSYHEHEQYVFIKLAGIDYIFSPK